MPYRPYYHPDIRKKDLPGIPGNIKERIRNAIKDRLLKDPGKYGEPLRRGLHGYRKLRVGDYRVIYRVENDNVLILKIGHRKEVYRQVDLRIE